MTDERLAELRALAAAATPGPWNDGPVHIDVEGPPLTKEQFVEWMSENANAGVDGPFWSVVQPVTGLHTAIIGNGPTSEANSAFIAAARTAIPELLDEIVRLERRARCYGCQEGDHPCKDGSWRDCYVELPCGCSECTLTALDGTDA